ncbi:MAG: hypothetical protein C5B58_09970, partial [Acidobacteria bacterium]
MENWPSTGVRTCYAGTVVGRCFGFLSALVCLTWIAPAFPATSLQSGDTSPVTATGDTSLHWLELADGWRLTSADLVSIDGATVSSPHADVSQWHSVRHMPATVLQALQDDGLYKDLYSGTNLVTPGDLWKKDWWYRTTFNAPAGHEVYSLIFKGINYRAEIWLNGKMVAENNQVVGMYNSFEFDVSRLIHPGESNVLAVKITPEQTIPRLSFPPATDSQGTVELGDTWLDWLNWKYIGVHDPKT